MTNLACEGNTMISEIETPFGKRILIKKRKIKDGTNENHLGPKYFEILQISSSGKIYNT